MDKHSKEGHSTSGCLFAIVMLPLTSEGELGLPRVRDWRRAKAERSPPEGKAWVV